MSFGGSISLSLSLSLSLSHTHTHTHALSLVSLRWIKGHVGGTGLHFLVTAHRCCGASGTSGALHWATYTCTRLDDDTPAFATTRSRGRMACAFSTACATRFGKSVRHAGLVSTGTQQQHFPCMSSQHTHNRKDVCMEWNSQHGTWGFGDTKAEHFRQGGALYSPLP